MSSRSLRFRLGLLLAAVTILSTAATFGLSYGLLASALRRAASEELRARLLEFWVLYRRQSQGASTVEVAGEYLRTRSDCLVRVADTKGNTLLLYVPSTWRGFDRQVLERLGPKAGDPPVFLHAVASGRVVEVGALELDSEHYVQIGLDTSGVTASLARFRSIFLTAALPLAALAFAVGMFVAGRSLDPIARLIHAMHSIVDTGRISVRLEARPSAAGGGDELDQLVRIFNRMLERIEGLVQGMRDALDNAAHDLRTPVTRLRNQAEVALAALEGAGGDATAARRAVEECLRQSETLLRMIATLLDIAEAEHGALKLDRETVDLAAVVEDMAELYSYAAEDKGIRLEIRAARGVVASVDVTRVRQALANLLDNAIKYTGAGGSVTVELRREGPLAVITVSDTGCGISAEDLPHIWERLYRGDYSRSEPGLGLGLSLVKAIVEAHGGTVAAESAPGAGASFRIALPAGQPSPASRITEL